MLITQIWKKDFFLFLSKIYFISEQKNFCFLETILAKKRKIVVQKNRPKNW
jgi:hypothetical protein